MATEVKSRYRELGEYPKNLRQAVNKHCRECNDAIGRWQEDNDCSVWKCWLYPFRPGTCGEERVVKAKSSYRVEAGKALSRSRLNR